MTEVLITALGVGGATVLGAIIGFLFKKISHRFADIVLSFAAGVMLAAGVIGLILPSIESGGKYAVFVTVAGLFLGAACVNLFDKIIPHIHRFADADAGKNKNLNKVLLFVIAIALHNLPEGIAAGVGFGSGDIEGALIIAGGIALQNIPEGLVVIGPMLAAGVSPSKTFLCAFATGVIEIIGTLIGYFAVSVANFILPFALAFAGGTMLYIISHEMIPETHSHGNERAATFALIIGFCVILITDHLFA